MKQVRRFSKTLQSVLQRQKKEREARNWQTKVDNRFNMVATILQDLQEKNSNSEMCFIVGFKRYD